MSFCDPFFWPGFLHNTGENMRPIFSTVLMTRLVSRCSEANQQQWTTDVMGLDTTTLRRRYFSERPQDNGSYVGVVTSLDVSLFCSPARRPMLPISKYNRQWRLLVNR
jgi:hypothetical protein